MLEWLKFWRTKMTEQKIAILGGTGDLGTGLAIRLVRAGYAVIIGSRTLDKAMKAKAALEKISPETSVAAMANDEAAAAGDVVVLTVPFAHQLSTLLPLKEQLQGKLLIDTTVPLAPPKVGTVQLPAGGSAVAAAQAELGDGVQVVSAFQNVAAHLLQDDKPIDCDVLICGNSKDARQRVKTMIEDIGLRGWHAGPLANSAAAEALTSILIQINRQPGQSHAGIKIISQSH